MGFNIEDTIDNFIRTCYEENTGLIERIEIDATNHIVKLFSTKLGPFIGRKGKLVNEVQFQLRENFGEEWGLKLTDTSQPTRLHPDVLSDAMEARQGNAKSRRKLAAKYGRNCSNDFFSNWDKSCEFIISDYSGVCERIPNHPDNKFRGTIVPHTHFVGWQGRIYCPQINALVFVKHTFSRHSGSIVVGSKIDFSLGIGVDNRGDLQFIATDWESKANRKDAPEPALNINIDDIGKSRDLIEEILSDPSQFVLITSYKGDNRNMTSAQIVSHLNNKFPNFPAQELAWPKFKFDSTGWGNQPSKQGSGRYTHPLIASYLNGAAVLFPPQQGGEEE